MNIAFVTQDEALAQDWISGKGKGNVRVHLFQQPEALLGAAESLRFDHIVLSDRYFDWETFCEYVGRLKEGCPDAAVAVLLSDRHDPVENGKWIKRCLSEGIDYIPPHRTRAAINASLAKRFFGEARSAGPGGKLIVFVGSTPNIGTTFVSFGTAVGLAGRASGSVAYLCLNLKSSKLHRYMGIDQPDGSLDHLRAEIRSQSLRPERLRSYCEPIKARPNLSVLFGNQLREQAEFFTLDDIEHLLQTAKATFDVCIVEVNAYWDNAATIGALLAADSRVLVTTPELTHFQEDADRWLRGLCPVIGLDADSFDLVLTQADRAGTSAGIRQRDIRKETGLPLIGRVGKYPDLTDAVNQGKLLDFLLGSHPLSRDLEGVVRLLSAVCGIESALEIPGSVWRRRFGRLFAAKPGKAGRALWDN
ncbi:AAA family ATPase [Paenibacillus flagellatus]|uniref:AAA domain-containing protein n=1 Tax=Paenibacillus flagellatus TaxID=2211139 RepID=A0A2V5KLE5_9BACL|nr:hypothetical protein [Paenibacillus flagellatus]PYI51617.1 hypothetical protein DLM86_24730 [Paenibacillus flagellatus]